MTKFLLLFVFCGLAQGQTETVDFSPTVSTTQTLCQDGLKISITGKDGKSDIIARCVKGYYERVPKAADETDGKPQITTCKLGEPCDIPPIHGHGGCPDCGIDVPAVQDIDAEWTILSNHLSKKDCNRIGKYDDISGLCGVQKKQPTCADKSRILLTSEDGHKWCHKVEPLNNSSCR